jgi:hypothetical protein
VAIDAQDRASIGTAHLDGIELAGRPGGGGIVPVWRTIFRPEFLFGFTTIQALSPYLFWRLGWGTALNHDNLTYYPVAIWISGFICFVVGSRIMAKPLPPQPTYILASQQMRVALLTVLLLVFVLLQVFWITKVYGTLPILSYLRQDGKIDIVTANQMQEGSALGQIGLFDVSLSWLNGALLLLLIIHYEKYQRLSILAVTSILFVVGGNLVNGKRQGVIRAIVYIVCGLALYSKSLTAVASGLFPIPKSKLLLATLTGLLIAASVYGFGYIALIRNQGDFSRDGFTELIAYQEYPLLNFEAQCRDSGYGPYEFNFFFPFQRLIPYKLMQSVSFTRLDPPVRAVPSSPAGFYEDIQWGMGPLGVIGLSMGIGMLSTYFYSRSLDSPPHLLVYCQMAYNLFVSHSFNEFMILAYFPGVLTVFLLCAPLGFRKRIEPAPLILRRIT